MSRRVLSFGVVCCSLLLATAAIPQSHQSAAPFDSERLHVQPHYFAGQTLHYRVEIRSTTTGHATGPVADPEGAGQFEQSSTFVVRLNVLDAKVASTGERENIRFRMTYEKVSVSSQSDSYDPKSGDSERQLRGMEGHSIEFTLGPNGEMTDVSGLDSITHDSTIADNVRALGLAVTSGVGIPPAGVSLGEKWSSEQPLTEAPISGTVWKKQSTYLRNEPCESSLSAGPDAASSQPGEDCAVILTHFDIGRSQPGGDPTPEAYRRTGLRTSGKWTGSGDSLGSISLRTGFVSSITQTSTQDMDFTISSVSAAGRITYSGHVISQMHVLFLPESEFPQND